LTVQKDGIAGRKILAELVVADEDHLREPGEHGKSGLST
jgi:hypothetical protein